MTDQIKFLKMEKELGGKLGSGLSHQNGCKYLSSYGYENIGKSYTGRVKTLQTIKIRLFLDLHDSVLIDAEGT